MIKEHQEKIVRVNNYRKTISFSLTRQLPRADDTEEKLRKKMPEDFKKNIK